MLTPIRLDAAGATHPIKVNVQCDGEDTIGERLCFAIKEKIRASKGFELVDVRQAESSPLGFGVHLLSLDAGEEKGNMSAISVVFTLPQPTPRLDYYLTLRIMLCGLSRIDDQASAILADIDKESDNLRPHSN